MSRWDGELEGVDGGGVYEMEVAKAASGRRKRGQEGP